MGTPFLFGPEEESTIVLPPPRINSPVILFPCQAQGRGKNRSISRLAISTARLGQIAVDGIDVAYDKLERNVLAGSDLQRLADLLGPCVL